MSNAFPVLFTAGNELKVFTFRLRNGTLLNHDLNGNTRSKTNDFATGYKNKEKWLEEITLKK